MVNNIVYYYYIYIYHPMCSICLYYHISSHMFFLGGKHGLVFTTKEPSWMGHDRSWLVLWKSCTVPRWQTGGRACWARLGCGKAPKVYQT